MMCCSPFDPLPESLLGVRHGQEPPDGQEVGPGVHQDEEEHAGGVERGELGVILHDVVKQNCNLDKDNGKKKIRNNSSNLLH